MDYIKKCKLILVIEKAIVKKLTEGKIKGALILMGKRTDLTAEIKAYIATIDIIRIDDPEVRDKLIQISRNEKNNIDNLVDSVSKNFDIDLTYDGLDDYDVEEIAEELASGGLHHYNAARRMSEISALIVNVETPRILENFINEARFCYGFEQSLALYALSRTILEIAIKDINIRRNNISEEQSKFAKFNPLVNNIASGKLAKNIKSVYYGKLSHLIHGGKTVTLNDARDTFHIVIHLVQELYTNNRKYFTENS